jgi:hypothetical protein
LSSVGSPEGRSGEGGGAEVQILAAVVTRRRATENTDFCHWNIKKPVPWNEIASVVAKVGWSGGSVSKSSEMAVQLNLNCY